MHLVTGCSHQERGNGCILQSSASTSVRHCYTVWGGAVLLYTKHSFKPRLHNLPVITHFCVLPRHWKWFLVTSLFPINKQTLETTFLSYLLSDTLKSKTHASAVSCPLLHRPEVTQVSFLTEIRLFPLFDALKRTSRAWQFSLLFSHTIL